MFLGFIVCGFPQPKSMHDLVATLKHPYFSLIIGAMASECKDRPWKVLGRDSQKFLSLRQFVCLDHS